MKENHNIRVLHMITGEYVVCDITQIKEENNFLGYRLLYPIKISLADEDENGNYTVNYRRWNPFTPYEDHRVSPSSVISAMVPERSVLVNYVQKLKEGGADLSFLPDGGKEFLE